MEMLLIFVPIVIFLFVLGPRNAVDIYLKSFSRKSRTFIKKKSKTFYEKLTYCNLKDFISKPIWILYHFVLWGSVVNVFLNLILIFMNAPDDGIGVAIVSIIYLLIIFTEYHVGFAMVLTTSMREKKGFHQLVWFVASILLLIIYALILYDIFSGIL